MDNNPKNNPNYRHHSTEKSKNNFINSLGKNYAPNSPYQSANSIKVNNRVEYPRKPRVDSQYVITKPPVAFTALPGIINFK